VELFGVVNRSPDMSHITTAAATPHAADGIRILLVEDNEINQQVATELLESAGASVKIANHGAEAVRILTEGEQPPPFDIVFMDLQMPEMDGYTAATIIRAHPRTHELPIIAMTAHALVDERQRCLEAGMNEHLGKPIDPDALFATLMRWAKPRLQANPTDAKPVTPVKNVILPDIDGVDLSSGLKRVNGNKPLYVDLLVQFAADQSEVNSQILAAIDSGDKALVERIAHTVKGVAGNLGLGNVFNAAEKLERAAREGDATVLAKVEAFTLELSRQMHAIHLAFPDQELEVGGISGCDSRTVSTAMAHLRALLESSDGDAPEAFVALEGVLKGSCDRVRLNALRTSINEFDFEGALFKLADIAKDYATNQEHTK
jgi:CheY-like chemotaxis protein